MDTDINEIDALLARIALADTLRQAQGYADQIQQLRAMATARDASSAESVIVDYYESCLQD